ncbi:coiled-coil domain-containing protein 42 [Strigops habroptila]|uniref:coiled-coil domain-containing protein 42 n=1 Tax=Strigops habroptila TaxID=2489341 RepID=UPI0011CFE733|nr:coiled-coil domain-containing protein 42 [Strigops habroptila]
MATMYDEELLDYFRIEYGRNLLQLQRKLRQAEEDSLSPFIRLQEKKKEAKLMRKALEAKKEEFKERMKAVACRWQDLHTQEAELKTHMEKSLRIVKEDDRMRDQALKKRAEEREKTIQKEFELLRARRELEVLRNNHEKLYNKVQKYSIFKKYLEDVVKISQETCWADIQKTSTKTTLELGTIRMAILNLFQCANRQMKAKLNVPVDDSHGQLNMIQQLIQDLADISMEGKEDMQDRQRAATPTGHANVRGSARVGRGGQRAPERL